MRPLLTLLVTPVPFSAFAFRNTCCGKQKKKEESLLHCFCFVFSLIETTLPRKIPVAACCEANFLVLMSRSQLISPRDPSLMSPSATGPFWIEDALSHVSGRKQLYTITLSMNYVYLPWHRSRCHCLLGHLDVISNTCVCPAMLKCLLGFKKGFRS